MCLLIVVIGVLFVDCCWLFVVRCYCCVFVDFVFVVFVCVCVVLFVVCCLLVMLRCRVLVVPCF